MTTNWQYHNNGKSTTISCINDMQKFEPKVWGFVYHLTLINKKTGKEEFCYIGKKNIYTKRKRKFGKKEAATITDKRKKLYEYEIKESDWKNYCSSNKFIKENKDNYTIKRDIIRFCTNDSDLSYREQVEIICQGTLDNPMYLNSGCSLRRFGDKIM